MYMRDMPWYLVAYLDLSKHVRLSPSWNICIFLTVNVWCYSLCSVCIFSACFDTALMNLSKFSFSKFSFFLYFMISVILLYDWCGFSFWRMCPMAISSLWTCKLSEPAFLSALQYSLQKFPHSVTSLGYRQAHCYTSHCLFCKVRRFSFYPMLTPLLHTLLNLSFGDFVNGYGFYPLRSYENLLVVIINRGSIGCRYKVSCKLHTFSVDFLLVHPVQMLEINEVLRSNPFEHWRFYTVYECFLHCAIFVAWNNFGLREGGNRKNFCQREYCGFYRMLASSFPSLSTTAETQMSDTHRPS